MLAARTVSRKSAARLWLRTNATLSTPAPSSDPAPPPAKPASEAAAQLSPKPTSTPASAAQEGASTTAKGKARVYPTRRPSITLDRPRAWSRPIGVGVLPAYDEALKYIKRDSENLKKELEGYRLKLKEEEAKPEAERNVEEVQKLKEKVGILEVQSEINLPSVRWKAKNGMADLSQPVYRHLIEQRWREEGALDKLMERIHQMNVVPDLLPELHPSVDLRVNFAEPPPEDIIRRTRSKRKYEKVESGIYLLPEQTWRPPQLYATVFHTDTRLYTLLMVDLDVPDPDNESFTTYLHWFQPNIPLSTATTSIPLPTSQHTRYIPPHPQKGTPYHRYVLLLVPQADPVNPIKVPHFASETTHVFSQIPPEATEGAETPEAIEGDLVEEENYVIELEQGRVGFDYRAFAEQWGLDASKGGGAFMWRSVWDETVSKIYRDVLKTDEPRYGHMPKPDRYADIKSTKKYGLA